MSFIFNSKYNSQSRQVEINKNNIEELQKQNFTIYNTQLELTQDSTTIAVTQTDIDLNNIGNALLMSRNGLLFKIVAVEHGEAYLRYYANVPTGPQGLTGPQGPQGPKGEDGVGTIKSASITLQTISNGYEQDIPFLDTLKQRLETGKVISADLLINTNINDIPAGTHLTGNINVSKIIKNYYLALFTTYGTSILLFKSEAGMGSYDYKINFINIGTQLTSRETFVNDLTDTLTYYYYE